MMLAVTHPVADRRFAADVRRTLYLRRWEFASRDGVALFQTVLRVSYPVATVIAQARIAPDGGPAAARVLVYRDGLEASAAAAPAWLGDVFDRCGARAYGLALIELGTAADAEAVVEDAFLAMARSDISAGDLDAAAILLLGGVRDRIAAILQRRAGVVAAAVSLPPVGTLRQADPALVALDSALAGLPDRHRIALGLVRYARLTRAEVAERMGLDIAQVTSILRDALRTLSSARVPASAANRAPRATLPWPAPAGGAALV